MYDTQRHDTGVTVRDAWTDPHSLLVILSFVKSERKKKENKKVRRKK